MYWKNLALVAAMLGVAVGCGDDDSGTGDLDAGPIPGVDGGPGGDDAGPIAGDDFDCGECFYAANEVGVGREDPVGTAPGFNLDGIVSDGTDAEGCEQIDFTSPGGTPGIDNQLATLAPTLESALGLDLETTIEEALADATILILMEITDMDNTADTDVGLNLYIGNLTADDTCTTGCIAAGKTFDIDNDSVDGSGNAIVSVNAAATPTSGGAAVGGGPVDLMLSIPFDETTTIDLNIRQGQVTFDVTNSTEGTLSNGLIGGSLNIEELITTVMAVAGDEVPADLVRTTLESVADLEPDGEGICQNLSVAITFGAVHAVKGEVTE